MCGASIKLKLQREIDLRDQNMSDLTNSRQDLNDPVGQRGTY